MIADPSPTIVPKLPAPNPLQSPINSDLPTISRTSMLIAAFSTVIEWYDFTLYLYFATVISRVFFGDSKTSILITLAGFAVSYLMRPIGAMVFGHIGDRYGRKKMMLLSMILMTLAMFATALLPTFAQIGAWSGGLLILLRCVMAFSVGGEYTGVVAYLVEGAKPEHRGFVTSLASAASEIGGLLAVGISALTVHFIAPDALLTWGWRVPFIIGAMLAGGVWLTRTFMEESPDFTRQSEKNSIPKQPLRYTLTHYKAAIARTFAISALGSITYYVGISYVPVFLNKIGQHSESDALGLSTMAALAVIMVTPLVGLLSDKVGRRPVLLGLAVMSAVLPLTLFAWMAHGSAMQAMIGAVLLACVAGGVSAVAASATAEQFSGEGRLSGLALGTTMATAIFGGLTPLLAQWLAEITGWNLVAGAMIAVVAVLVLPILWFLPETAYKFKKLA